MHYLLDQIGAFGVWALASLSIFIRYLFIAGGVYLIFYVWKRKAFLKKRIQQKFPRTKEVNQELLYSIATAMVFAGFVLLIGIMTKMGWTKIYNGFEERNWAYMVLTFLGLVFFHDTYFYWMHRFMHQSSWLRKIHGIHHLSHNPTPLAAHSFHPLEAVLEFAFLPVWVMLVPTHILVLLLFAFFSLGWNVIGHLGYELFPAGFVDHPVFKWLNTSTHHNLHHQKGRCNYGLYFNFWDSMMATNHKKYKDTFNSIQK